MENKELISELSNQFRAAGFNFISEPAIGGLRPSFLINGSNGVRVVIEVKDWDPKGGNTARAIEQVEHYKKVTGAEYAFIIMPNLKRNNKKEGILSDDMIVKELKMLFELTGDKKRGRQSITQKVDKTIFAAMPFNRKYDDTFFVAITYAAKKLGAVCKRVDKTEFTGDIIEEIKQSIKDSIAVIIDLSESKPNVLYEAGYAHALEKPSIHICSTDLAELPFDVRNWNTLKYDYGQTSALKEPLTKRLRDILKNA